MAITTTQVVSLADSVAQAVTDFTTNFVTGTASGQTTINTGVGGTGAAQTLGRVLGLNDLPSDLALLTPMNAAASSVAADLSGRRSVNAFYANYYGLFNALDNLVGGLNAYLTTNTLTVNANFANAFNAWVALAVTRGDRSSVTAPVAIATANFFPNAAIDTMWGFTSSGATTFSANAVGANPSTAAFGGGVGTFYIYHVMAGAPAGGAAFTITYTNAAGNSAQTTYNTSATAPTGAGAGNLASLSASLGIVGSAITAVSGTGMTNAEQYVIGIRLVRGAQY